MTTTFDTSGAVIAAAGTEFRLGRTRHGALRWSDLSPFTQGYMESLLTAANTDTRLLGRIYKDLGFSDLAPETLARIIADCEAWTANRKAVVEYPGEGAALWAVRQCGGMKGFPPLTVQLGDDGKVVFSERG